MKRVGAGIALMLVALLAMPVHLALADEGGATEQAVQEEAVEENHVYVASFFGSDYDWTDSVYVSADGETFSEVSVAPNYGRDPSIMWHDGRFWVMTCRNDGDGMLWFRVSSSTDLVNWSIPTTNGPFFVDELPDVGGAWYNVVAPEWFVDDDGSVHIIVSCGFWGANHGMPTNDHMQAYLVDVESLTYEDGLCLLEVTGEGQKMSVNADGGDRIDGTIDHVGDAYWLTIKRDGLSTELWKNLSLSPSGWVRVRETALYGFEGNCVVPMNGGYCMYADGVPDIAPYGVRRWVADGLESSWVERPVTFLDEYGYERDVVRHGTVLEIGDGTPEAKQVVDALLHGAWNNQ